MTGKWDDLSVPKGGWACIDVTDLGVEDREICEMCEVQPIRYVHIMDHPKFSQLEVGCVCAGYMEGNVEAAKTREQQFKARLKGRIGFANRKNWSISRNGNPYIRTNGCLVTLYPKSYGWGVMIKSRETDQHYEGPPLWGPKISPTIDEAKLYAYDLLHRFLKIWV